MNNVPLNNRRTRVLTFWLMVVLWSPVFPGHTHQDTQTHARLSVATFLFLDQSFPSDGASFPTDARTQARQGSINEDNTPLFFNHFFNPKTYQTIDIPFYDEVIAPERARTLWIQAIQQYHSGDTNGAFDSLGHVLHLLQDMTSPAHVHLDDHGNPTPGAVCEGDTDDFENWGYCPDYGINAIFQYVAYADVANSQILSPLATGLQRIFGNQPQKSTPLPGENTSYAFVRDLANKVYDFTSFYAILEDTPSIHNDLGAGELKTMFPSLIESGAGWTIDNLGYSAGDCGNPNNQDWWMMDDPSCLTESCGILCKKVTGSVYIENTGGGGGLLGNEIPDTLIPAFYNRPWFRLRYNIPASSPAANSRTMLRIYGDVLYAAAVAHGAGLLQAFLDEAIMPKPVTQKPTQVTLASAQLNGSVQPAGNAASAWFEWGPDANYGTVTSPQDVGSGSGTTNLNVHLDGLLADTDYYFRIVSSNRYGLRYGTNQIFRTPKQFLITGNLPNAWQITDHSASSLLNYTTNLTGTQPQAAANNGWRYTITSRMVDDFGGTKAMTFLYQASANKRFLIWWDLDSNGNLTAEMEGQSAQVIAAAGAGATSYHTHELVSTNGTATATYLVDGVVVGTWSGQAQSSQPAGLVYWGSGSSGGMGQMNFRDVDFAITTVGTVASYHAGVAGVIPPNPVTQGWTANPASPTAPNAFTPISGETDTYLSSVETLEASDVGVVDAQLNGRADPRGEDTVGWFEWGDSLSYGNLTQPQPLGSGFGWTDVSEQIIGLVSDQTYHFRAVASNAFAVVFGADQQLVAVRLVVILSSEVPVPGQFHLQFAGTPGTPYVVDRSTDLSNWNEIGEGAVISQGVFEFLDTAVPPEAAFYRIRANPTGP